jgi:hypothetical protein
MAGLPTSLNAMSLYQSAMYTAGFTIVDAPYHCSEVMASAIERGIKGYMKLICRWRFVFKVSNPATSLVTTLKSSLLKHEDCYTRHVCRLLTYGYLSFVLQVYYYGAADVAPSYLESFVEEAQKFVVVPRIGKPEE